MMKISFVLQAVNRVSAPLGTVNTAIKKLGATATATGTAAGAAMRRIGLGADQMARRFGGSMRTVVASSQNGQRAAASLGGGFRAVGVAAGAAATRIGGYTAAVRRASAVGIGRLRGGAVGLYDFGRDAFHTVRQNPGAFGFSRAARGAGYLREQVSGLTTGFSLLKYASIAAGIGLGEEFVRGVFKAGGEMQQTMAALSILEGSESKARASMAWMQRFSMGAGASMSFPDIMDSYQMAKEGGMKPESGSLSAFADLAAGWRKPLNQVIFAVKDAMMGSSTRPLANLGIKMHQDKGKGGGVSFTYQTVAGKSVTERTSKDSQAILKTIVKAINAKYAGIAAAQAKTVPGGIEQMKKLLYSFEGKVAQSGVFDWALAQMNKLFAFVRQASADGSLDRWAANISRFMTSSGDKIIAFVRTTDWAAVGRDLALIGGALVAIAKGLAAVSTIGGGGISGLLNLFVASKVFGFTQAILGLIAPLGALSAALIGVDIAVLPIDAIIALIAALAAGAWLIYSNWSSIGPKLTAFFKKLWDDIRKLTPQSWADLSMFLVNPGAALGGMIGRAFVSGAPAATPRLQPGPPRGVGTAASAASGSGQHKVGGTIGIEFLNAPTPLVLKHFRQDNPDIHFDVRTGHAMAKVQ